MKDNRSRICIATARNDGTTERVNAILNGLHFAQKHNLPFHFSWVNDNHNSKNKLLDINPNLPDFFSRECKAHFLPLDDFRSRFSSSKDIKPDSVTGVSFSTEDAPGTNDTVLIPTVKTYSETDYAAVVNYLFDQTVSSDIAHLNKEYQGAVGIHYRGGDVIYGRHRMTRHALFNKSASLAMVEAVIAQNKKSRIIVFGTPVGETLDELRYLSNKYNNVELAVDIIGQQRDGVIKECFLMSYCSCLYSAAGTGVSRLAKKINRNLELIKFVDYFSKKELLHILEKGADNKSYSDLQRCNNALKAIAMKSRKQEKMKELILALDPKNNSALLP